MLELSSKFPYEWGYIETATPGKHDSLVEKLHAMSTRVRESVGNSLDSAGVFAENLMKYSAAGAIASSAAYVAFEAITRSGNTNEALIIFATAVSIGLATREQLREQDTYSLPVWRRRDRD